MGKQSRMRLEKHLKLQEAREKGDLIKKAQTYDLLMLSNKREMFMEVVPIFIDNVFQSLDADVSYAPWNYYKVINNDVQLMPPFQQILFECNLGDIHVGVYCFQSSENNHLELFSFGFLPDSQMFINEEYYFINLDRNGYFLSVYFDRHDIDWGIPILDFPFHNEVFAALKALQLLNCRNILLTDHIPDPEASKAFQRHFGQPMTKYKMLRIKSTSEKYDSDNLSTHQDIMPLHLRRGNFAHYGEDAPLFGKYTGTFWRPATVVGNEKNGTVVKDYKIEVPEKQP